MAKTKNIENATKAVYPFSVDAYTPSYLSSLTDKEIRLLNHFENKRETQEDVIPSVEEFFSRLNQDMIDTENKFYYLASSEPVTEQELEESDKFVEVRSDFVDEDEVYIDAWKTSDDNEEGVNVARIDINFGDVQWYNTEGRFSRRVQEEVDKVLRDIELGKYNEN